MDIDGVIVVDSFLGREDVVLIQEAMLGSAFPWFITAGTIGPDDTAGRFNPDTLYRDRKFLGHAMYHDSVPKSDYYAMGRRVLEEFCEASETQFRALLRMQGNLTPRQPAPGVLPPHVDVAVEHDVVLFYVNDSDGDTIFFDETGLIELGRVTPKAGRCVRFPGGLMHAAAYPVDSEFRCVINYNVV